MESDDRRLGESLLQRGLVSRPQLAQAWAECQASLRSGRPVTLAEVLIARAWVRRQDLPGGQASASEVAPTIISPAPGGDPSHSHPTLFAPAPGGHADHSTIVGTGQPVFAPELPASLTPGEAEAIRVALAKGEAGVGPYHVIGKLGEGGMGEVLKAWDPHMKRLVALKRIRGDVDRNTLLRFEREAQLAGQLRHPGIAAIYQIDTEGPGAPYLAMEYVAGECLVDRCRKGKLSTAQAAEIALGISQAIEHAHQQGILHRDLKPHNVMLTLEERPVVLDFGLAKQQGAASHGLTATGQMLGTVAYMAPEQIDDARSVGTLADVYGLGAILYECLCGAPPFTGSSQLNVLTAVLNRPPAPPSSVRADVHRDLETICLKCLEKDPADRYASAEAVADDLRRFLDHAPILARPSPPLKRLLRRLRRQKGLVVAACLILGGAGAGLEVIRSQEQAHEQTERERVETTAERDAIREAIEASQRFAKVLRFRYLPLRNPAKEATLIEKSYAEARGIIDELDALIAAAPGLPDVLVIQGDCYLQLGKLPQAVACADRALELDETHGPAWRLKGEARMGRVVRASAQHTFLQSGRSQRASEEALECFTRAREHGVDLPELAQVWYAVINDDLPRAVTLLDGIEDGSLDDERVHFVRGVVAWLCGLQDQALSQLTQSLEVCPRLPEGLWARGALLGTMGKLEPAMRDLDLLTAMLGTVPGVFMERGIVLVNNEQPRLALAEFERSLQLNPRSPNALYGRGVAHQKLREFDESLAALTEAVEMDPSHYWALRARGLTHKLMGDYPAALADLDRAQEGIPDELDCYLLRAEVRALLGDDEGAIADWTRVLGIDPQSGFLLSRANLHLHRGDLEAARADALEATRLDPERGEAWGVLGSVRQASGDVKGAVEAHLRAVEVAPDHAKLLTNAACALYDDRQLQRALSLAERAVDIDGQLTEARFIRARLNARLGNAEPALADYTVIVELDPDDHQAWVNRGRLKRQAGDLAGALEDHDRAVALGPGDAKSWWARAQTKGLSGDRAGSTRDYDEAIRLAPTTATLYAERGHQLAGDDPDRALADFARALEFDPEHREVRISRARLHLSLGEPAAALEDLDWVIERAPGAYRLYELRAKAKAALEDHEGAGLDLEECLRIKPDQPQAKGMRKFVEKHLGRPSRY